MLTPPDGFPDWLRLAICAGLGLIGVVVLPGVLGLIHRKRRRPPAAGAWSLCAGGCLLFILAAFSVDFLTTRADEQRRRDFALQSGLVLQSSTSSAESYVSPPGWSMQLPSAPGSPGGRATHMNINVTRAQFAPSGTIVTTAVSAAGFAGLFLFALTRTLGRPQAHPRDRRPAGDR